MIAKTVLETIGPVIQCFEELGVSYVLTGSVVSTAYGINRSTVDVDMVVDLLPEHVPTLVARLEARYYIDAEMLYDTIRHRSSANLLDMTTWTKIDIYIPKGDAYEKLIFSRARCEEYQAEGGNWTVWFTSPEDVILRKLEWYKLGGGISERQRSDVLGVLKIQSSALDLSYMHEWAAHLGISDLLDRALDDAGL